MPTYDVYNLMDSSTNFMTFSGDDLTPEEAVISAHYYDNKDTIDETLIDYIKNNLKNVRTSINFESLKTYYNYNDYCVAVKKS